MAWSGLSLEIRPTPNRIERTTAQPSYEPFNTTCGYLPASALPPLLQHDDNCKSLLAAKPLPKKHKTPLSTSSIYCTHVEPTLGCVMRSQLRSPGTVVLTTTPNSSAARKTKLGVRTISRPRKMTSAFFSCSIFSACSAVRIRPTAPTAVFGCAALIEAENGTCASLHQTIHRIGMTSCSAYLVARVHWFGQLLVLEIPARAQVDQVDTDLLELAHEKRRLFDAPLPPQSVIALLWPLRPVRRAETHEERLIRPRGAHGAEDA
jgi:hypothetical protein